MGLGEGFALFGMGANLRVGNLCGAPWRCGLTARSTRTRTGNALQCLLVSVRLAAYCRRVPFNSNVRRQYMPSTHQDAVLNTFAIRSFRDTADRDYVHARLAYRARLVPQFQWSALHCLEKYAKGILVLNRVPARGVRHEVSGALNLLAKHGKFEITLSDVAREFIERLEDGAEFRYFEVSYSNERFDIARLDRAVSEIRRYCQPLDWDLQTPTGTRNLLEPMLNRIRVAQESSPRDTCIMGGWLENLLRDSSHPARVALVWQNLYFGASRRRSVRLSGYIEAGNSPLYMHPEILDEVLKYVFLPKRIEREWRDELARRIAEAT